MLKTLTLTVAIGAVSALLVVDASALPVTQIKQVAVESPTTLVRDGCGRGMRFSNSRQTCVEEFGRGPSVRVIPQGCGPGMRFSNSQGGCVPVEGRRGNGVGLGLNLLLDQPVRSSRGSGCGPGFRFSNSRQSCVPN